MNVFSMLTCTDVVRAERYTACHRCARTRPGRTLPSRGLEPGSTQTSSSSAGSPASHFNPHFRPSPHTDNYGGDGHDVWPFPSSRPRTEDDRTRYDCSKLDQWEVVFEHASAAGLMIHIKTQETENDQHFDAGDVGRVRKLYYRELVARFGHHLAVTWNLGEENSQSDRQRVDMAQAFFDVDAYHSNVVIHNACKDLFRFYSSGTRISSSLFATPMASLPWHLQTCSTAHRPSTPGRTVWFPRSQTRTVASPGWTGSSGRCWRARTG